MARMAEAMSNRAAGGEPGAQDKGKHGPPGQREIPHETEADVPASTGEPGGTEAELASSWDAVFSGAPPPPPDPVVPQAASGLAQLVARQWPIHEVYRWFAATGRVPRAGDWADIEGLPSPEEIQEAFGSFQGLIAASAIEQQALPQHLPRLRDVLLKQRRASIERERALRAREQDTAAQGQRLARREQTLRAELEADVEKHVKRVERESQEWVEHAKDQQERTQTALSAVEISAHEAQRKAAIAEQERERAVRRAHALAHRLAETMPPATPDFVAWYQFPSESFQGLCDAAAAGLAGGALCHQIVRAPAGTSLLPAGDGLVEVERQLGGPVRKLTLVHSEPLISERDPQTGECSMTAQRRLRITVWQDPRQAGVLIEVTLIEAPPLLPDRELAELSERLLEHATPLPDGDWPLGRGATRIGRDEVKEFVSFLESGVRSRPVLVLSSEREQDRTADDPSQLAAALCGAAHVVCLEPQATFALTELVGSKLTIFGGQARCYQPGFSRSSVSGRHPRLDPHDYEKPQQLRNALMLLAMTPPGGAEQLEQTRAITTSDTHDPSEETIEKLARLEHQLLEQRSIAIQLSQTLASGNAPEQATRLQLGSVADATALARRHARHLRFSPKAFTTAAQSFFTPAQEVYDALMLLDQITGEYIAKAIGMGVGQRAQQLGLTWRGDVSNTARTKYATDYECPYEDVRLPLAQHIVVATGRGADRTCRIYLYLCDGNGELPRGIYVGHVGRHLPQ